MQPFMRIFVLCLGLFGAICAQAQTLEQGIHVTGEGRVSLPPDLVTVRLGITATGQSTSAVLDEVNATAAQMLAGLDALGIAARDRQTAGFYLHPIHENRGGSYAGPPRITGFEAGNTLSVRIRDLDRAGGVLDQVIALGANQFNGLSFGLENPEEAMALARARAVADAQSRARQLAEAAGVTLGPLRRMSEHSAQGGRGMMAMAESRASFQDALASGEVDVMAQVTLVFDILPKAE